jgi:chloramphenicol-sensitive protein RarD
VGEKSESAARTGLLYGLTAYGLWGIVPLYFKAVAGVPAEEILAHRIVWSAIFLLGFLLATGRIAALAAVFRSRRALGMLALSTLFVASNWYVFIYSVMSNQMLQGSLGYFILPLVNVAIGTIFFGERMRMPQWFALIFVVGGVAVLVVWLGLFPWIAITLAVTFSIYGVIRKHAPVDGTVGLTVETLLLAPIAAGCLLFWGSHGSLVFGRQRWEMDVLLILSGLVTSIPLMCFAQAVRRLRIVTIGFLQYISPSIQFLLAVALFQERFPREYQVGYGLIWCGLTLFVGDAVHTSWKTRVTNRREAQEQEDKIREMEIMN